MGQPVIAKHNNMTLLEKIQTIQQYMIDNDWSSAFGHIPTLQQLKDNINFITPFVTTQQKGDGSEISSGGFVGKDGVIIFKKWIVNGELVKNPEILLTI
jgi:hypothetical protein